MPKPAEAKRQKPPRLKLPPPIVLAQLAAGVGPSDNPDAAIKNAVKLWLRTANFCHEHAEESLDELQITISERPEMERALVALSGKAEASLPPVPQPDGFPATLKDFLRLIVNARTPADGTRRLRNFLRADFALHTPRSGKPMTDQEDYAAGFLARINEGDKKGGFFSSREWENLATDYLKWWKLHKSQQARESASKQARSRA